jgi:hypothetical protein
MNTGVNRRSGSSRLFLATVRDDEAGAIADGMRNDELPSQRQIPRPITT